MPPLELVQAIRVFNNYLRAAILSHNRLRMMTRNRFPIQLLATLMLIALATPYARPATCGMMPHPMEVEHLVEHDMATSADHGGCDDCTDSMDCCAASLTPALIGDVRFLILTVQSWPASRYTLSVHTSQLHTLTPPPQA
jgi:hypothetical protein